MTTSSNRRENASPPRPDAPVFLMSPPRRDWTIRGRANVFAAQGAHDRAPADLAAGARADWLAVATAIEEAGGLVVVVDNASEPDLTGLPYTAEAGLCGRDPTTRERVFVLPRLTPSHRRSEPAVIAPAIARLGLRTVSLSDEIRFEGQGDVVRLGTATNARFVCTAGVGPWARTDPAHVETWRRFVDGPTLALTFHADPWFHGNTFLGGYAHGSSALVLVCEEALRDDGARRLRAFVDGARVLPLSPDETLTYATNALQVNDTVLAPAPAAGRGLPDRVVDAWRELGLAVRFLPLPTLLGRGGGAAVCLTNRLDGVVPADVPEALRLSTWRERNL